MTQGLRLTRVVCFTLIGLLSVAPLSEARDLYDLLQIPRSATEQQIKRAYRKLAKENHPDKVTGSEEAKKEAQRKFADINHAYEVLSDDEKREVYDRHGEEGLKRMQAEGGGGGGGDPFASFFGGGGFFGDLFGRGQQQEEEQTPKGHDVLLDLHVTLQDLYVGRTFKVHRDKNVVKQASGTRECNCKNKVITHQIGPGMYQQFNQKECERCPNVKLARESEELAVHVEAGMKDGQEISFFEEGEPMVDGEHGDLKFVIRTTPHPTFERHGNDLWHNHTITLLDALVGFKHEIEHLDGHKVALVSSDVTKPFQVSKVAKEGMPLFDQGHQQGDLYVRFLVDFPATLSPVQRTKVKELFLMKHDEL